MKRPGTTPLTERSSRVAAARKLTRRSGREKAGKFLAEGAQAVTEALTAHASGQARVRDVFATESPRHLELTERARAEGIPVHWVTERAAAALSETVTPQGLVAVCDLPQTTVDQALAERPGLVAILVGVADPGNAGTVVRVADAAGAGAVLFAGNTVDVYNGKAVRASTGSVFHLPVARSRDVADVLVRCREAGLQLVGADGYANRDLHVAEDAGALRQPTAWVFGSEAHGLPDEVKTQLDFTLRVPLYGRAESLNLATAAAVCLYASARVRRHQRSQ
ncbi:RNA methyltransferase [Saccharopolyspora rectivirgula]|uniref:RNA methyltransferase n=1 Tax=Saccharopolyspora rectivirgula TaxID=28042 RepID=A0A073AWT0_9PSEU|nr:RNA methyltransferase [Saccharopolyspora rectivirgula]